VLYNQVAAVNPKLADQRTIMLFLLCIFHYKRKVIWCVVLAGWRSKTDET